MKIRVQNRKPLRDRDEFKNSVREWAVRLKVQPAQIRIQKMKHKWASCSPGKWISFNDELLHECREFQEYVIAHELLHLRIPNHGKLFKSIMAIYIPDWERWTRECAREL